MRAVRMAGFGGPEVLRVDELTTPQPDTGEILIEVEAAGVAYGDIMKRQGAFGTDMPIPAGLGQQVAGVVAARGAGVDGPPIGSRVTALVEHGYAEYAVAPAATVVGVPDGVDYSQSDWPQVVLELTSGRGVDLVLDSVGGVVGSRTLDCVAPFGRIVTFGAASGEPTHYPSMALMTKALTVSGYGLTGWLQQRPDGGRAALRRLLGLVARGDLEVVIGGSYPLERAADAHRAIAARHTVGKMLLVPQLE